MSGFDKQVAFRLPSELVSRIDQRAANLSSQVPGMSITRADVVRSLIVAGLDAMEPANGARSPQAPIYALQPGERTGVTPIRPVTANRRVDKALTMELD